MLILATYVTNYHCSYHKLLLHKHHTLMFYYHLSFTKRLPQSAVLKTTMPPKAMPKASKLDKAKSLAMLGFFSSRTLDTCLNDPEKVRKVLDKALYKRSQEIQQGSETLNLPNEPKRRVSLKR